MVVLVAALVLAGCSPGKGPPEDEGVLKSDAAQIVTAPSAAAVHDRGERAG